MKELLSNDIPTPIEQTKVDRETDIVYEDDNWILYSITGFDASRFYASEGGQQAQWCISINSLEGQRSWDGYFGIYNIYFLLSKTKDKGKFNKIAIVIDSQTIEFVGFADVNNDDYFDINELKQITGIDFDNVEW